MRGEVSDAYYAAVYAEGETAEWCLREGPDGYINGVTIGGEDAWYMLGHAFWNQEFSKKFLEILETVYELPETRDLLWEGVYMAHLEELKLKIRKYPADYIFEFDTLDELRMFDSSYIEDTRSKILKATAQQLRCREADITDICVFRGADNKAAGFTFSAGRERYEYVYRTKKAGRVSEWRKRR